MNSRHTLAHAIPTAPFLFILALATALTARPETAAACTMDAYMGTICMTAARQCPRGYLPAEGQTIGIDGNTTLYSLLMNTYGGTPGKTFRLPDLRGRVPVNVGHGAGLTPVELGELRGEETHRLSDVELANHSHNAIISSHGQPQATGKVSVPVSGNVMIGTTQPSSQSDSPADGVLLTKSSSADIYAAAGSPANVTLGGANAIQGEATGPVALPVTGLQGIPVEVHGAGQGLPFPIIPPQLGLQYCIAIKGPYPPPP